MGACVCVCVCVWVGGQYRFYQVFAVEPVVRSTV